MNFNRYSNSGYGNYYVRPRLFKGALRSIIVANVAVFVFMMLFQLQGTFSKFFGLVPSYVWGRGYVWQLFTYMFIHGGFGHIFFNMFALWMFGMELENRWGRKEFYRYYFLTGIGSGLITMLFSWNSSIPVVGASGAIYAILLAFGMMFPERLIYFYFLIPIKAKYFVMIMGVITFISTFNPGGGNISHLTHLGGLLIGFLYLKRFDLMRSLNLTIRLPKIRIKNPFKRFVRRVPKQDVDIRSRYDADITLKEEVDRILDKINKTGYDSLDENEKRTLLLASQYFANRDKHRD